MYNRKKRIYVIIYEMKEVYMTIYANIRGVSD